MTLFGHQETFDLPEYECIDPGLGQQMWRLADPHCPDEWKGRLETHRAHCAHCRLQVAFADKVEKGLRDGRLHLKSPAAGILRLPRRLALGGSGLGAAALAAALGVLMLLPPRSALDGRIVRGDHDAAIIRPVPDEVTLGGNPQLSWTPLQGATRYNVEIQKVGGGHTWTTTTQETQIRVPEGMELPVGQRYRVMVEPVPRHVAPDGHLGSSFSTGSVMSWLGYRLRQGQRAGQALAVVGLALLAFSVPFIRRR